MTRSHPPASSAAEAVPVIPALFTRMSIAPCRQSPSRRFPPIPGPRCRSDSLGSRPIASAWRRPPLRFAPRGRRAPAPRMPRRSRPMPRDAPVTSADLPFEPRVLLRLRRNGAPSPARWPQRGEPSTLRASQSRSILRIRPAAPFRDRLHEECRTQPLRASTDSTQRTGGDLRTSASRAASPGVTGAASVPDYGERGVAEWVRRRALDCLAAAPISAQWNGALT